MNLTFYSAKNTMSRNTRFFIRLLLLTAIIPACSIAHAQQPQVSDPSLEFVEFASDPLVVTPTGIAVDHRGRVFVLESHSHFRPDDYDGPPADRVLILHDSDGDGRADKSTIFHQGLRYGMDLAFHPDGTLYLATRWAIYRLPDQNGDDRADRLERIIDLRTEGDYPHNGLSGLAFDPAGNLQFGLGENLGAPYRLVGSDGRSYSGGGEGGSTYRCDATGGNLERTSTGWWNPFGLAVDSFGRVFGTDNDPGASPPCRLIEVHAGGDYGYEYRYGRTGLNPLISWTGDLAGVLPMLSGTGEAPCGIIAYEGSSLPARYHGALFVPTWADHHIELYTLQPSPDRGQTQVERSILVQGDNDFRPVDIALSPNGSLFVSDWVLASYSLHGRGRVWQLRSRKPTARASQTDALVSPSRLVRERASRERLGTEQGQRELLELLDSPAPAYAKATAVFALMSIDEPNRPDGWKSALRRVADRSTSLPLRALAARTLADQWNPNTPEQLPVGLFAEWLTSHTRQATFDQITLALASNDRLLQHAAIVALADRPVGRRWADRLADRYLWAVLRAARRGWRLSPDARRRWIRRGLFGADASARLLAIKWIADDQVQELAVELERLWQVDDIDFRSFRAIFACQQRLAGEEVTDWPAAETVTRLMDRGDLSPQVRKWLLEIAVRRRVPIDFEKLVRQISEGSDAVPATWALVGHPDPTRRTPLRLVATNSQLPTQVRSIAIVGLADFAEQEVDTMIELLSENDATLAAEALRALPGVDLTQQQIAAVRQAAKQFESLAEETERAVTGKSAARPPADDTDAWVALLAEGGDPAAGERLFFHPKIATCAKCHAVRGRGMDVGPSMSAMSSRLASLGAEGRHWLLRAILQPSAEMAPQYTPWLIRTVDGHILTGLPRRKGGNAEAYLNVEGIEFIVKKVDIEEHRESTVSLMPDGLLEPLTKAELRDLIAFLEAP